MNYITYIELKGGIIIYYDIYNHVKVEQTLPWAYNKLPCWKVMSLQSVLSGFSIAVVFLNIPYYRSDKWKEIPPCHTFNRIANLINMFCNVTVFVFNFLELGLLSVPARNSLWNNKPVLISNTILGKEDSNRKACTVTEKHTRRRRSIRLPRNSNTWSQYNYSIRMFVCMS
jgi:hypothetical protein